MSLTKVSYSMITGAPVNVRDYGADPSGVTDSTSAFQAAINYCQDTLRPLYIPSNNPSAYYRITGTLSVTKPLVMYGDGSRSVTLYGVGLSPSGYLLDIDGTAFGTFENGYFGGFTVMPNSGNCIKVTNVSVSEFEDIGLRAAQQGFVYTGTRCFSNVFRRIYVIANISGTSFQFENHTGGGQHDFYDCSFGGNNGVSINANTVTDSVNFYACNFEQCTVNSFYVGGSVSGLGFYGCRTEGCNGADFQINPEPGKAVTGVVVEGCGFSASDAGGLPRISIGGAGGKTRGFNINANSVSHGANNFSSFLVNLNGEGESGTIANNYLDGLVTNCAPVNVLRPNVAVYNNEANNGKFSPGFTLETSTWTPADSSGAGLTFTLSKCVYSRVGNIVTVSGQIVFPSTASSADIAISGLPFPVAAGTIAVGTAATTNGAYIAAWVDPASSQNIRLRNASYTLVPNSSLSTGTVVLSLTYFT